MFKNINLKLLCTLVGIGVITSFMVLPFTFALIHLPEEVPFGLIVIAQTIQVTIILMISCFIGMKLLPKTSLTGFAFLDKNNGTNIHFTKIIKESIVWGVLGGILSVLLCIPFWNLSIDLLKVEMNVDLWKSSLACFYGGFGEEIMFRLGMMTFFVWILNKLHLNKISVWASIIISGIIFGLGHLGITSDMTTITFDVILRAVLLNGSLSIIYGYLYWKKGIESAMIAHFSTDVVLHILIPHLIAPLLIP